MILKEFVSIVYGLVIAKRWDDLAKFLEVTFLLITTPTVTITPGTPVDKEN